MPVGVNFVFFVGRLVRDLEVRQTKKGTSVANGTVAIKRFYRDSGGSKKFETTFVEFTVWGSSAEMMSERCGQGDIVMIEGKLKQEKWDDPEGKPRRKLVVWVELWRMLEQHEGYEDGDSSGSEGKEAHERAQGDIDGNVEAPGEEAEEAFERR